MPRLSFRPYFYHASPVNLPLVAVCLIVTFRNLLTYSSKNTDHHKAVFYPLEN